VSITLHPRTPEQPPESPQPELQARGAANDNQAVESWADWLRQQWDGVPTRRDMETPSGWAEKHRYLPPALTPMPGHYRFSVAPYLREIVDCFGPSSPVREITVMKGAQVGVTVGVLENAIGFYIAHVKRAPMMFVTADDELAKLRVEQCVVPMLHHSGLMHLVQSSDRDNARKSGKTEKKIEWQGGGYVLPFGAQSANKMRTWSIQVLLNDEIDAWPDTVGKDGDPLRLVIARTAAYEQSRKIGNVSTPTIKGQSKIADRFYQGDQRRYFVCCLKCGFAQALRWRHVDPETGVESGLVFRTESGRLIHDSVRYVCRNPDCGHAHHNDDKTRLLAPDNAEWRATAPSANPQHRSYHLSALYSPVGMQSWETCADMWCEAWDVEANRARDVAKLQVFYNTVLGEPFEMRGERLTFEAVSAHRRDAYRYGEIPNHFAIEYCGGPILLVVCTVDVHADHLPVTVWGWARDRRVFLIDYWRLAGDTSNIEDPDTWGKLRELVEHKTYIADDGKRYRIELMLIDSGFQTEKVYEFAHEYQAGVYPVKGRDMPAKGATFKEFSDFTTKLGTVGYSITVDFYKDRWHGALRRQWSGVETQPSGLFNAPLDATDKQLKELTTEVRRVKVHAITKQRVGFEWHRPSGAANELWDCLIYANAALDLVAWDTCVNQLQMEAVEWVAFYDRCAEGLFFTDGPTN